MSEGDSCIWYCAAMWLIGLAFGFCIWAREWYQNVRRIALENYRRGYRDGHQGRFENF